MLCRTVFRRRITGAVAINIMVSINWEIVRVFFGTPMDESKFNAGESKKRKIRSAASTSIIIPAGIIMPFNFPRGYMKKISTERAKIIKGVNTRALTIIVSAAMAGNICMAVIAEYCRKMTNDMIENMRLIEIPRRLMICSRNKYKEAIAAEECESISR